MWDKSLRNIIIYFCRYTVSIDPPAVPKFSRIQKIEYNIFRRRDIIIGLFLYYLTFLILCQYDISFLNQNKSCQQRIWQRIRKSNKVSSGIWSIFWDWVKYISPNLMRMCQMNNYSLIPIQRFHCSGVV